MASLKNSEKEVMGPPPKRQKLATGQPSIVNQTKPRKDAKMDDRLTRLAPVDNGFQPEREAEVGILYYVNPSNPGFSGTLKQRYVSGCYPCLPFRRLTSLRHWYKPSCSLPFSQIWRHDCSQSLSRGGGGCPFVLPHL